MPASRPRPVTAYRVPFHVERPGPGRLRLVNAGAETVSRVLLLVHGPGLVDADPIGALAPGEAVEARVRGRDLALATSIVVRWFREDGDEYLWRIAF